MRKVIVDEWLTLDGVAQAPGEKNEDTTVGFRHGGWHMDYVDETFQNWMLTNLNEAGFSCLAEEPMRPSQATGRTPRQNNSPLPSP